MLLVTSTLTVQVLGPAAEFTPVPPTVKVPAPAAAVMVGAPPQLLTTFGVAAITRLAGNASLNVTPLRTGDPAAWVGVKVGAGVRPWVGVVGEKVLLGEAWTRVGCWLVTPLVSPPPPVPLPEPLV